MTGIFCKASRALVVTGSKAATTLVAFFPEYHWFSQPIRCQGKKLCGGTSATTEEVAEAF